MVHREARRSGLTLVEILVALTVTTVVVATGRVVAEQLAETNRTTSRMIELHLGESGQIDELRRMLRLAVAPLDSVSAFEGEVGSMAFGTRCTVPRGWDEDCRCDLRIERSPHGYHLVRECTVSLPPDTLVTDSTGLSLLYLVDPRRGGQWLREWGRSNTPPVAIGIVRMARRDTTIVRVGYRG